MLTVNILSAVAVLASYVSAAPAVAPLDTRAVITSGVNQGSIFMFGDAAAAKQIFWTSGACGLSTYFPKTKCVSSPFLHNWGIYTNTLLAKHCPSLLSLALSLTSSALPKTTNSAERSSLCPIRVSPRKPSSQIETSVVITPSI